jgi:hypothetical protein
LLPFLPYHVDSKEEIFWKSHVLVSTLRIYRMGGTVLY